MELRRVVIQKKARGVLKMLRLELHVRRGREAMRLLPAGDQRLLELAPQGFSAEETQEATPLGKAPEPLGIGRAQPLKLNGQLRRIEIRADRRRRERVRRQVGRRYAHLRQTLAVGGAQPPIRRPDHLDRKSTRLNSSHV